MKKKRPKYSRDAWKQIPMRDMHIFRDDFKAFCLLIHESKFAQKMSWLQFHDDIANVLIDMYEGRETRASINLPPRAGKTYLATMFMAWSLGKNPESEFIYASYSNKLATKTTAAVKDIVTSPAFKKVFPKFGLDPSTKAKDYFKTNMGGSVYATSTGGTVTGFGAGGVLSDDELEDDYEYNTFKGMLIVDDLLKASDANSPAESSNAIEFYEETLENRLNDALRTPILIIAQRLAKKDVVGVVLDRKHENWKQVCVKAMLVDDEGKEYSFWESKFPLSILRNWKKSNPSYFSTQFQQEPISKEGRILKQENFRRFDLNNLPEIESTYIFADTALTKNQRSDPSCLELWGRANGSIYLLDAVHGKWDTTELEQVVYDFWKKCFRRWMPSQFYVEAKASGFQIIQSFREKGIPVEPIQRHTDKITRANNASPQIDKGYVYIPTDGQLPITSILETEAESFPAPSCHDDTLDPMFDAILILLGEVDPFADVNPESYMMPTVQELETNSTYFAIQAELEGAPSAWASMLM